MQPAYQDPEDAEEFLPIKQGYQFADSYCDRLTLLYSRPETQHLSRERWRASEICTYRDRRKNVKHEYLVATLKDNLGNIVLIRFERGVQGSVIESIVKSLFPIELEAGSTSPPAGADSAKQEAVHEQKSTKEAIDQISIVKPSDFNVTQVPVERVVFDPNNRVPSLPELIILARAIGSYSRRYHLTQYNYSWFCYLAIEYLKRHYLYPRPHLTGRNDQATWPATVHKKVDFEVLGKIYDRIWNDFKQGVCSIIH